MEAADFPNELERCRANLVIGDWWLKVKQWLDAATHWACFLVPACQIHLPPRICAVLAACSACYGDLVSASPLNFHLAHYDGPLDLLLDLIRKQQINIYDIPIAQITAQYVEYMQKMVALDIELSSEFVFMAATLIHIKSRMLLPRDPELEKISPEEDPRKELVERLIQHEQFKNAAEMLQQKRLVEEAVWSNPQIERFLDEEGPSLAVSIFDLVRTFQRVLDRVKTRPVYEVDREDISVPGMMRYVRHQMESVRRSGAVSATKLFETQRSQRAMICLFLAILELVKRRGVQLTQSEAFGDIDIERGPAFEDDLDASPELEAVEEEYR